MYCYVTFEAEFLSFCCCTEPCQKNQQRRRKWKSLSLPLRSVCSAMPLDPAERIWRIYADTPFSVCSSKFPNLLSRQATMFGTKVGSAAFAVSWREALFCKVTTTISKLSMSLMSKWRDKTVIFMKPIGVCLFESGSLMSSLLQLWLLSAPVSVGAYWDFSSNCCRKLDLALDSGFKIFLTCCDIVPHFQILNTSKVTLTRIRVPTDRGLLWAETCLWFPDIQQIIEQLPD